MGAEVGSEVEVMRKMTLSLLPTRRTLGRPTAFSHEHDNYTTGKFPSIDGR